VQGRRAKTSFGPESMSTRMSRPTSPYGPSSLTSSKPSPRRPSLASIFCIGHKNKQPQGLGLGHEIGDTSHPSRSTSSQSKSASSSAADGEEEDWDRTDSVSDLDAAARALGIKDDLGSEYGSATVRGRSPYLQCTQQNPRLSLINHPVRLHRNALLVDHSHRYGALGRSLR
jgi:hypothetical protein